MPDDVRERLANVPLGAANAVVFRLQGLHGLGLERRFIEVAVREADRESAQLIVKAMLDH